MSKSTEAPEVVPVQGWWHWKRKHQVHLMYHGGEEVLVTVVEDDPEGLFFKLADNPDELLFVSWSRIKQVRGPAFWTREPKPVPVKKKPAPKKAPAKKAPQAELLAGDGGGQ
jgi:hypothetical protein